MSAVPCDACGGKRLSKESLAVTVGGKNISDFCDLSVVDALAFLDTLTLTPREEMIAGGGFEGNSFTSRLFAQRGVSNI